MFDKKTEITQIENKVRLPLYIEGKASTHWTMHADFQQKFVGVDATEVITALSDALGYELRAIPTGDCNKFSAIAVKKAK